MELYSFLWKKSSLFYCLLKQMIEARRQNPIKYLKLHKWRKSESLFWSKGSTFFPKQVSNLLKGNDNDRRSSTWGIRKYILAVEIPYFSLTLFNFLRCGKRWWVEVSNPKNQKEKYPQKAVWESTLE